MDYEIICWPESQELFRLPGFREHCKLVDGPRGLDTFGSSAYLVPLSWYAHPTGADDAEVTMVYDDELEALYLM